MPCGALPTKPINLDGSEEEDLNEQVFYDQHNDLCEVCNQPGKLLRPLFLPKATGGTSQLLDMCLLQGGGRHGGEEGWEGTAQSSACVQGDGADED